MEEAPVTPFLTCLSMTTTNSGRQDDPQSSPSILDAEGHLTDLTLAAYLDRALAADERQRVQQHLASCDTCRREAIEIVDMLTPPAAGRRWKTGALAGLAAAAALAGILIFGSRPEEAIQPPGPVLRGAQASAEGVPKLLILAPSDGATLEANGVSFTWRPAGKEASYRLTLAEASGDVLWRDSTSDTTLTLPSGTGLKRGALYYWYVDALLPDGGSATTGVHRFRTEP